MGSTLISENTMYTTPSTQIGAKSWETAFLVGAGFKINISTSADLLLEANYNRSIEEELAIEAMSNAGNPLVFGMTPLLVCDVWEHAYYLDCQNDRLKYLDKFWKLINWNFLSDNLKNENPYFEKRQKNLDFEAFIR